MQLNSDQMSSLVWLAIGGIIMAASFSYGLGSLPSPGTGLMPFLSGMAVCFFAAVTFIQSSTRSRKGVGWNAVVRSFHWKKSITVFLALFTYTLLLVILGFIASTVLMILFLMKAVQPQRWLTAILGAVITALSAYILFEFWLECQLPKGLWGF
jgi:putative tricarboxylic transport membrane protein